MTWEIPTVSDVATDAACIQTLGFNKNVRYTLSHSHVSSILAYLRTCLTHVLAVSPVRISPSFPEQSLATHTCAATAFRFKNPYPHRENQDKDHDGKPDELTLSL